MCRRECPWSKMSLTTAKTSLRSGATSYMKKKFRAQVEHGNEGKAVAIDIDSGEFEVADDALTASDRLVAKRPNAQTWVVRIGHPALHRFGPRNIMEPV